MKEVQFNKKFESINDDFLSLSLISFEKGNDKEIPFYWYDIILKETNEKIGKISIRIGYNYHSYYNGNVGYEIDYPYRRHNYSYFATKLLYVIAKYYQMDYLMLTCDEDNIASFKTIERLGGILLEIINTPKDYFGYYEGMPKQRIYQLNIN